MFTLLVIALVIASMVENRDEFGPDAEYALEGNNSEGLLANINSKIEPWHKVSTEPLKNNYAHKPARIDENGVIVG